MSSVSLYFWCELLYSNIIQWYFTFYLIIVDINTYQNHAVWIYFWELNLFNETFFFYILTSGQLYHLFNFVYIKIILKNNNLEMIHILYVRVVFKSLHVSKYIHVFLKKSRPKKNFFYILLQCSILLHSVGWLHASLCAK